MPGALAHSPADVTRYVLIDDALGTLPEDKGSWPVHVRTEPNAPDNVITVYGTSSRLFGREHAEGEMGVSYGIQVRVRSATYTVGSAKANAIAIAMDAVYQRVIDISGTQYLVHAFTRTTDVLELGQDPNSQRQLFVINATVTLRQQ